MTETTAIFPWVWPPRPDAEGAWQRRSSDPMGDATVRGAGQQRRARLRSRPSKRGWVRQAEVFGPQRSRTGPSGGWIRMPVRAPVTERTNRLRTERPQKHRMPSSCPSGQDHASVTVGSAAMPAPFAVGLAVRFAHRFARSAGPLAAPCLCPHRPDPSPAWSLPGGLAASAPALPWFVRTHPALPGRPPNPALASPPPPIPGGSTGRGSPIRDESWRKWGGGPPH